MPEAFCLRSGASDHRQTALGQPDPRKGRQGQMIAVQDHRRI
jgi:hypothetical protein